MEQSTNDLVTWSNVRISSGPSVLEY
jgi:hypothetical protein